MKLNFRVANLNDIEAIVELVNSAYRGEFNKNGWTTEADILDGIRADHEEISGIITDKAQIILLCFNNQTLIGTVALQKKSDCAYLGMLTVRSDLQAGGIGKQILATAED